MNAPKKEKEASKIKAEYIFKALNIHFSPKKIKDVLSYSPFGALSMDKKIFFLLSCIFYLKPENCK